MRWSPRKLTMQLTPLLDLLLIVIFAQFMEVREESRRTEETRSQQQATIQRELKNQQDRLTDLYRQLNQSKARERLDEEQIAALKDALNDQTEMLRKRIDRLKTQRDLLSKNLAEMFRVPEAALKKALEPLNSAETQKTAAELKRLQETVKALADSGAPQIVRHIIKYEELLKRCDILEIHVGPENLSQIQFGRKLDSFRFSARRPQLVDASDEAGKNNNRREIARYKKELQAAFVKEFAAYCNQQSEFKNVVILLLSKAEKTPLATEDAARFGLGQFSQSFSRQSRFIPVYLGQLEFVTSQSR
ncbi:MAG: hypothetical protein Tsb009_24720 [Planctomycetaceae bacterium]